MTSQGGYALPADLLERLLAGRLHDPTLLLGLKRLDDANDRFCAIVPGAAAACLPAYGIELERIDGTDVFVWSGPRARVAHPVRVRSWDQHGHVTETYDPYSFASEIETADLEAFGAGRHCRAHRFLGAHVREINGVSGTRFAVWAPNAERVSVVGNFNGWDGRHHPMIVRGSSGIWELFIPEVGPGELYKFEIRNRNTGALHLKSDPYGRRFELRPANSSIIEPPSSFDWDDAAWIEQRRSNDPQREPISIYELHLGSWRRTANGEFLNFRDLAAELGPYVKELGFTHVELLPISEHPFDDSWGYQTTGFFAPTSRFGSPDDFRSFVSQLHALGIGVILDWVPGHFPKDDFALARFDSAHLYEYSDPRKGEHPDWQTLVFDYSRNEVRSFLLSSAVYWLDEFHIDALRVDAVASMLYLDYSRHAGAWTPNVYGGNENLEAIEFLKQLNVISHGECPGTLTIAEESTAWPKVSRPTYDGGLGFTFKWNMGWMHDTLLYMRKDPVHRSYHHNLLTFGPIYAFTENFLLPLSHDEVVHGKGSLLGRMPGDRWQQFANLRLLYTFQWTYPGKKLLFMGGEFGQPDEWNHRESLPWHLSGEDVHAGITRLIRDLNRLYRDLRAFGRDTDSSGFYWLSWEDAHNSVLSYTRRSGDDQVLVALNFTPVPRHDYRIGVPFPGRYREILNSDSRYYGGSDVGNALPLTSAAIGHMRQPHSISVSLPPLGGIILVPEGD